GLRFEVVPSRFKEKLDKASFPTPYAYAIETAKQKALELGWDFLQKDLRAPDIVIGADTIVTVGGLILEKPVDKQDAYRMLSRLNGKEHSVFTGVAIVHCCTKDGQLDMEVSEFHEETTVKFSELSEELLWDYIDSGEPMDKAGGYGIQALGGMLVEYVRGDFLNVVGFPLNRFCKKLVELYYPPRREDVQRVKHDSIPPVDTFENLSDVEGGSSDPAQGNDGGGHGRTEAGGDTAQASAGTRGAHSNGMVETPPPFPVGLLELIDGFKASKALFTACKLKVFDVLKDEAPLKAVDVAGKIDASVCGTERLLDVCVALGLLEKTDRGYRNTELADLHLASDGAYSLHGLAMHNNDHFWNLFADLELAVREGADAAFGRKTADPVQVPNRPGRPRLAGVDGGQGGWLLTAPVTPQAPGSTREERMFVGRGSEVCTGLMHRAVKKNGPCYSSSRFAKHFLPVSLPRSPFPFQNPLWSAVQDCSASCDFFKDGLPQADLYILSRILHDWPDHKVQELLSRVSSSCKPGGGILVAEMVLEENPAARGSLPASLNLLVRTQGRERSLPEYRRLLEQHGFSDVQLAHAGDRLDVILGTRASP
ncbi:hypothetical protein PANDA_009666, partial [Ailuropoda melanoleuca]